MVFGAVVQLLNDICVNLKIAAQTTYMYSALFDIACVVNACHHVIPDAYQTGSMEFVLHTFIGTV